MQLEIYGEASNKTYLVNYSSDDLEKNLMDFLISNKIPVASTCLGEGVCKKCIVNEDNLCCQFTLLEYISKIGTEIKISYL